MIKTNALHRGNNPKSSYPKANKSDKWNYILKPFWDNRRNYSVYEGEGVVVIPSDPNSLLERLIFYSRVKKRVIRVLETSW